MTEHLPYPHLADLGYCERSNLIGLDAPRALLHVDRCPCGADTVRPYEQSLIDLMREEWGTECRVDERIRARVMRLTYDPAERDDIASREVWPEAVRS